MRKPDAGGWLAPAFGIVAAVTALRLVLLRFDQTDLFVDESQYWLWGQHFAFGYYSKPPLIAWVIGAVTTLAGSDAPFWVRAPGAVFHAATALILAALAARLHGGRVALLVAVSYVTLPMAALGSLLISTDTIMAPFFAAALYFHFRLLDARSMRWALLAGGAVGMAFLAKYAAVYFLLGVALGAIAIPSMRIAPRHAVAMLAAFALVILPNILWNMHHGFSTLGHTLDNVGWVRPGAAPLAINLAGLATFFFGQFGVFGPVLFAALIWAAFRPRPTDAGRLLVFAIPAIAIVCAQALIDRAYANWAASAYFAGTIVAVAVLASRPRLMATSLAINCAIAVILPVMTLMPGLTLGRDKPLLSRYIGLDELSHQILDLAKADGNLPIVADRRDVLADLFYTGQGAGLAIYAPQPKGAPENHYEQTHALPAGTSGTVLYVTEHPPVCDGLPVPPQPLDTAGGAYAKVPLAAYVIPAGCLDANQ